MPELCLREGQREGALLGKSSQARSHGSLCVMVVELLPLEKSLSRVLYVMSGCTDIVLVYPVLTLLRYHLRHSYVSYAPR